MLRGRDRGRVNALAPATSGGPDALAGAAGYTWVLARRAIRGCWRGGLYVGAGAAGYTWVDSPPRQQGAPPSIPIRQLQIFHQTLPHFVAQRGAVVLIGGMGQRETGAAAEVGEELAGV